MIIGTLRPGRVRIRTLIAILLLNAAPLCAKEVPVRNSGFEDPGPAGGAAGWTVMRAEPQSAPQRDDVRHASGGASLRITHVTAGSTTVESDPLTLAVGRPYRLTARVKTEGVFTDGSARYPTAIPATLSMASFPFTNHATAAGASRGWTTLEVSFFATSSADRIRLHLGYNGAATGSAWFDDITLEEVEDIGSIIPLESVRWHGPAFRYTDRGWIVVHIEGEPYPRGVQYGSLLAREISAYLEKLAIMANETHPEAGWNTMRTMADAMMLRGYRQEYLEEMQGIADGAARAGAAFAGRPLDFLDIVTVNSAVDLGQLSEALGNTAHPLSGRTFRPDENEEALPEKLHKCSSFLANGSATRDGGIVFGQIFMWRGYTGVHWDVICDLQPSSGHRLVYQTFPGGIHSGSDFYINDAGIMIGETTVMQTPFNAAGTPQSSRIREAAQYASSVDDVVRIMTARNNGLYTNDWLIGDCKTDEIAILCLGTHASKLWRSSRRDFYGGQKGFYWSVNNAKDPEVRKEYIPDPRNAPFDVVFGPVNRDLTFVGFYHRTKGAIDAPAAARLLASSPINRPHACDGKITTSEMAAHLVFLAHYGKVTQREKFPEKNYRLMPDLPGAMPHLSLGYAVISPRVVNDMLRAAKGARGETKTPRAPLTDPVGAGDLLSFPKELLWSNTVHPAADRDNWFVSGSANYWKILDGLPSAPLSAAEYLREQLGDLDTKLAYTVSREGAGAPLSAVRSYEKFGGYQIPRVRGIFALHQLRFELGNALFSRVMNDVHRRYGGKAMSTEQFITAARGVVDRDIAPIIMPWIRRADLPRPQLEATAAEADGKWEVAVRIRQNGEPFVFRTTVAFASGERREWRTIGVASPDTTVTFTADRRPDSVLFNIGNDIPSPRTAYYTLSNLFDDFDSTLIVYGTAREEEANHTLAVRYQSVLADAFTEILSPLRKDAEVTGAELEEYDLMVLGGPRENSLVRDFVALPGLETGVSTFRWNGIPHASPDEGFMAAVPNPRNPARVVYVVIANSAMQLYEMTRRHIRLPSWALYKGDRVVEKGYFPVEEWSVVVKNKDILKIEH